MALRATVEFVNAMKWETWAENGTSVMRRCHVGITSVPVLVSANERSDFGACVKKDDRRVKISRKPRQGDQRQDRGPDDDRRDPVRTDAVEEGEGEGHGRPSSC